VDRWIRETSKQYRMTAMVAAGERIGRYRLKDRVGAGAFATVWLGYDEELDITVAVKVLADNWSAHADVRDRFLAEARLMRRIADDRVIRVHDIGTLDDDRPYFVMDFANGGTLANRVGDGCPPQEALLLGAEAARAVQVLHDHGVLHRDVTPANLLVDHQPDGSQRVVVTDLGMAKAMAEMSGLTLAAGTPAFMAPEQAGGLGGFDARADVYSLGAVVYALLSGRPPFTGSTLTAVLARSESLEPELLAASLEGPAELDDVLSRALSHDPVGRPASARELATALDRVADDWTTGPRPGERPAPAQAIPTTAITPVPAPLAADTGSVLPKPVRARPVVEREPVSAATAPAPIAGADVELRPVAQPAAARQVRTQPRARGHGTGPGAFWVLALLVFAVAALVTWFVLDYAG
jgi:serine/threonine protein kinase